MGAMERLATKAVVAFWRRREAPHIPQRQFSPNPSDNVQVTMNLIMPLADPSPIGKAQLVQALASAVQEVTAGLNNTQIVHHGRFVIVGDNLCMFSVYDGDFADYIRDFIYNVGAAFDALLAFVEDPPPLPVEEHPDAFVEWVREHDAPQLPFHDVAALNPPHDPDLTKLPRRLALLFDARPSAQVFVYQSCPGVSDAQIRHALGQGW